MNAIQIIFVLVLRVIYFFFKFLPTRRKIVYLSRQSNVPSTDYRLLNNKISQLDNSVKQVLLTRRIEKNLRSFLQNLLYIIPQMYHIATSRVCITDGYCVPISVLNHKSKLKVFQIWHSLLALKSFGHDALNTPERKLQAKTMKMHRNYDYITCSSDAMADTFSKCFNTDKNRFLPIGLPRIDYLINNKENLKNEILSKYPEFEGKKVVLYAPTFRDYNDYRFEELFSAIDFNDTVLIVKPHPNTNCIFDDGDGLFNCSEFSAMQLLTVADFLITDYSGIIAEASAIETPVLLFTYDYDEYNSSVGINIDLNKEFEGCIFSSAEKLVKSKAFKNYDLSVIRRFKEKYVPDYSGNATEKLAKKILEEC